ncbi:MAG: EAL domain-containing protein, partial [Lachnospiraceae bacterium]|nr:EAL domain-containing protein [Lachnospiraceae bacterium]
VFLKKISGVTITQLESAPKQSFEISAWVGISELEEGRDKPFLERFNEASVACVLGKTILKKLVVTYSEELSKIVNQGHDIIANFRPAIRNNEFHPYFQPKIDMRDGSLVGFEAICRWLHAGRVIYPDQFIPILDKEGLIPELDLAILDRTCALIKKWKKSCLNPPTVSINFSKKNLFVPKVEYTIMEIIKNNGLTFDDVEIEITESVREAESERLIEFIRNLKDNGMRISIDDFGTGYSSLALIHSIDADVIKIDKSFIRQLPDDTKSRVLLESIISIANRLNMTTVAEGVETAEQGKELLNLGCNIAQGYYYSRPVDWETATKMIKNPVFKLME